MAAQDLVDQTFGPMYPERDDFTLSFEDYILIILPAVLMIIFTPFQLRKLLRRPSSVGSGSLLWAKMVIAVSWFFIEIGHIIFWGISADRINTSIATATLSATSSLCIVVLLWAEHTRSLRSSSLISVYLSLTMLFSIARSRSYFLRHGLEAIGGLSAATTVLKLSIVALEEVSKRSLAHDKELQDAGKETFGGFWNRAFLIWINSTLIRGYRTIISMSDLQSLPIELTSERLYHEFESVWSKTTNHSSNTLMFACVNALGSKFYSAVFVRLCYLALSFAQPFLVHRVVEAINEPNLPGNIFGGIVGAFGVLFFALAVTQSLAQHLVNRKVTAIRGYLVSAIYHKVLKLDQPKLKESGALTLMSTDVDCVESASREFHEMWSAVISVAVGTYVLSIFLGGSSFIVLIPACITTYLSTRVSLVVKPASKKWNEKIQVRLAGTSDALQQMRSIKMTGLDDVVADELQGLLDTELKAATLSRTLLSMNLGLSCAAEYLTPVVVVAGGLFWTRASTGISVAGIFASLTVVNIITDPLFLLVAGTTGFLGALGSFERIQEFLLLEEIATETNSSTATATDSNDQESSEKSEKSTTEVKPEVGVKIVNASVQPLEDGRQVLKDISAYFSPEEVAMLIGPVGCGKSLLLKLILGEATIINGEIHVDKSSVAYCDQTPWLQNTSLKNSIIGESPFSDTRYRMVLSACQLLKDLEELPGGDEMLVGTGGCKLSGGQRLRVALARAVYAKKRLLLLDDIFSGLDQRTAKAIFQQLLGPSGLLRTEKCTVIMTTNFYEHLSSADQVLQFSSDSKLAKLSSRHQLLEEDYLHHESELPTESESESQGEKKDARAPSLEVQELDDDDPFSRKKGDISLWLYYFKSFGLLRMILWTLGAGVVSFMERFPAIFIRIWISIDPTNNLYFIGYAGSALANVFFALFLVLYLYRTMIVKSYKSFHWQLVSDVMSAKLSFLSTTDVGSLLNRFSQDMVLVGRALPGTYLRFASLGFSVLVDIGIIASATRYAPAIIPVILILFYLVQHFYLRTSRQMRHLDLEAKSPLYTLFTETSNGVQHIRAFKWETNYETRAADLLDYSQKSFYAMYCIQQWLRLVMNMIALLVAVVIVSLSLGLRSSAGTSQAGVGLALLNLVSFSREAASYVTQWTEIETALGAIARLRSFSKNTPTEKDDLTEAAEKEQLTNWPSQGHIAFEEMGATYDNKNPDTSQVLTGITFEVQPRKKVALVGRTGSGKTSLILSTLHLLDYSGSIKIDGVEVRTVPRKLLRSRITTMPQDLLELHGTLRFNLFPFKTETEIQDSLLIDVLTRLDLWSIVEPLGGLDAGFQTLTLSQGQKQLMGLARAMAHHIHTKSKVAVMDEATSFLDPDREQQVQAVLAEVFADCTMLVVSHRDAPVAQADMIATLSNGRLIKFEANNKEVTSVVASTGAEE